MEFEEHSEEEMGMDGASYDDPSRVRIPSSVEDPTMVMRNNNHNNNNSNSNSNSFKGKYKECQKNHAVSIGGYSLDGCCEFIAAGAEGTLDALKCAACNCHRNFHRKETAAIPISAAPATGEPFYPPPYHHNRRHTPPHFAPPCYRAPAGYLHVAPGRAASAPAPTATLALPSASGGIGGVHTMRDDGEEEVGGGGGEGVGVSNPKKRFRTKFTQEQKEKMLVFAERLGWRMQKHDDGLVQEFCNETGVKRNVLKVWMHNNKHTLGKKP